MEKNEISDEDREGEDEERCEKNFTKLWMVFGFNGGKRRKKKGVKFLKKGKKKGRLGRKSKVIKERRKER